MPTFYLEQNYPDSKEIWKVVLKLMLACVGGEG